MILNCTPEVLQAIDSSGKKKKEKKRKKKQSSRNQDCFSLMSLPGECLKSLFIWYIFQALFKYLADTYLTHKQESS